MKVVKLIQRGLRFLTRQENSFKTNLLRVSTQNFFLSLTQQFQSLYIVALGATPFQLGIVNSVGGLAGAVVATPTGWLADRYGIRRILLLGTPLMVLGALIFALAPNWMTIILAILLARLALRMVMTVCPMVCGSCLKSEERATGMQLCDTLSAVPRLIAPVIGSMLVTWFGGINEQGIRPLYYLQAIGLCLVLAFISQRFTDPSANRTSKTVSNLVDGVQEVLTQGTMVKRWLLYLSLSTIPMAVSPVYLPLFTAEIKHADQLILGGIAAASMVAPLSLSIVIGRLADTIGRKKVIYLTTPVYCVSLLLLIYAHSSTILLASGVLQGFFMLSAVTQGAMTAELVPTSLLGRWYGLLGLFRGSVTVLAPVIGGVIWGCIGPEYVFFFLIATQLFKLLILMTMPETLRISRG
jgi:MFS family permease